MKTTQALAAVACLFPLALADHHSDAPHSSSVATGSPSATITTVTGYLTVSDAAAPTTTAGSQSTFNHLGCYKVGPVKGNPISADQTGVSATLTFNSYGACAYDYCGSYKYAAVMAGNMCYCSDVLPEDLVKADDGACNVGCTGYDHEPCGGAEAMNLIENKYPVDGGKSTILQPITSGTAIPSGNSTASASSTSTSTKGPASSDPVTAGAAAVVGQSWAFLAGVGAVFFL